MSSLREIYLNVKKALGEAEIENAALEARRLISYVAQIEEDVFITNPDEIIASGVQAQIYEGVQKRVAGEPLSKIMGQQEFWGLNFKVTEHTLDPRADTETLIEAVLEYCQKNDLREKPLKILDLGTGTGCILIALLHELPNAYGVAVDYSIEAAKVAVSNGELNAVNERFSVMNGNWASAVDLTHFDIIVSNPPYIRDDVILELTDEVKNHDPYLALSGGQDGLDAYKKIIHTLKNEKKLKAHVFFEIGFDQHEQLVRLVDDSNLWVCDSKRDLSGNPRVVEICRGDK